MTSNKSTEHLTSINSDIAQTIEAALKLGDLELLKSNINWIENLLMGYRLPKDLVADYILTYYQAARIHLDEPASIIIDWLSQVLKTANIIETE